MVIFLDGVGRQETALTINDLAARVHMGNSESANARLHEWMRSQAAWNGSQTKH